MKKLNVCIPAVGAVAKTKGDDVCGNSDGTLGLCYDELDASWSFIFENGCCGNFTMDDFGAIEPLGFCYVLTNYEFEGNGKLDQDFESGAFDPVFKYGNIWLWPN